MGNSGNPIDTNLTPENIKDGVSIFGVEGNYIGLSNLGTQIIYGTDPEGNDWFFDDGDHSYRAVELGDFIYMFASHEKHRVSGSRSGMTVGVCKYSKISGDFFPIGVVGFDESGSNSRRGAKTYSSYVNGTNIVLNYSQGSNNGRIILDTTDDSLSSVLGSLDTAGTLFSTEEINFGGVDHKANIYYVGGLIVSTYYKGIVFYYSAL